MNWKFFTLEDTILTNEEWCLHLVGQMGLVLNKGFLVQRWIYNEMGIQLGTMEI